MSASGSSPTKWKSQQRRLRGRLGIDVAAQAPAGAVVLPPLPARSSPRHVGLARLQREELSALRLALRQRIETTRALVDLTPVMDIANCSLRDGLGRVDTEEGQSEEASCFTDAKQTLTRLETAPFLNQFMFDLLLKIERLVHAKRQQELAKCVPPVHPNAADSDAGENESPSSSASQGDSSSSSDADLSGDEDEAADEDNPERSNGDAIGSNQSAADQDLRHVRATRAVFRTTLRSRKFPPTRVPPSEFVQKTSSHLPFDHLKRPMDLASLRLRGHDEFGSAQWSMVLFPKNKPSLTNQEELQAFAQWAEAKQLQLAAGCDQEKHADDSPELAFEKSCSHFKATLALKELICFELSRFIFDKCPTTARFLHRLFVELVEVALLTLANTERAHQIMEQRHKNVQLELTRLNDKLTKVQVSLASVEDTLAKRQQMLLRERELIIRKRKKLNLLLGADQVLIRRVAGLIYCAQEIGDDILQNTRQMTTDASSLANEKKPGIQNDLDPDAESRFSVVDEIVATVIEKYRTLPQLMSMRENGAVVQAMEENTSENQDLIVLDTNSVQSALDEYKATLLRLSRMMSSKSPDSSIGWDAQELWDQALFIPPHEEIQDLERDVQRLSLLVEERILQRRHQRTRGNALRTISVQTEIGACMPKPANQNQRWRARPFVHQPIATSTPAKEALKVWNWRQLAQVGTGSERIGNDLSHRDTEAMSQPDGHTSTLEDDHRDLLHHVVPDGFRVFIRRVPRDYTPQQLDLHQVHNAISYLLNGVWMLVQEDFHRPPRFSTNTTNRTNDDARLIPLTTLHEYIYRIFLQHFHIEGVVTGRILDLLLSASRLDTQSCKVQLFCRLLGLPGVATFPSDGFWFVLKSLHVLQRCCGSSGGYFLLDGEGDNEYVPQASATEAISQLFPGSSSEVQKRLRLKLSGLASVYGAVWIPAYNILTFIMDEWKTGQDALQVIVEEKLFLEHASEMDPFTGNRIFSKEGTAVSFSEFLQGFQILKLHVNRSEAVQAYRQLLVDSAAPSISMSTTSAAPTIDRHRFYVNWMQMILHAVNVSQQQMLRSANSYGAQTSGVLGSSGGASGPGVQLGAISDAMLAANQNLSFKFLLASWEQMKPEIIRRLDMKFNDVGLQVRLVQQMQAIIAKQVQLPQQQRDSNGAWRSFHQLIQTAYSNAAPPPTPL